MYVHLCKSLFNITTVSNRSKSVHNVASNHLFLFLFSAADSLEDRQQIRDRYPFKENTGWGVGGGSLMSVGTQHI